MTRTHRLPHSRLLTLPALVALVVGAALMGVPAQAVTTNPPDQFGSDWDDPQTAAPPVQAPDTKHCTVTLVQHDFDNYDPATSTFTPPNRCRGQWSKVVLRLDGSVKGRQYDRIGRLELGGVTIFRLSTPEPSPDGINWHVEKDVTEYAPLMNQTQQVQMWLGNTVNSTYTGVFHIHVTLTFYKPGRGARPARTADQVLPLTSQTRDNGDLVGDLTVPRNTKRLVGEVYASGSGGGCEEFWDTSAPASTGYSCSDGLPYREVDVLIDGRVAGIALPYPQIYTGGWSNPYLWAAIPAPRAFNISPVRYDLTPFVGELTDGQPHQVRLQVAGVPEGQGGWSLYPDFQVWQDHGRSQVHGRVTSYEVRDPQIDSTVKGHDDQRGSVDVEGSRSLHVTGHVDTSSGRVTTNVSRRLTNTSHHAWADGESHDALSAKWHDRSVTTTFGTRRWPRVQTSGLEYSKHGHIDFLPHPGIPGAYDITTELHLGDKAHSLGRSGPRVKLDTFDGTASWIYNVPRDQRHATAHTQERYRLYGDPEIGCYDHRLATVNGSFVTDRQSC
ncbi:MAG: peptide-N4-asparagine amidase [Nocardioidaceae bacterium]